MPSHISFGERSRSLLIATMTCWLLVFSSCDSSKTITENARGDAAAGSLWNPTPIEFPKATERKFTADDEMHVTDGPIWPGDGSPSTCLKFNWSGDTAFVRLANGVCHNLDPKTGQSRNHWSTNSQSKIVAMELSVDGKYVIVQRKMSRVSMFTTCQTE